jgi:hypothetical protein
MKCNECIKKTICIKNEDFLMNLDNDCKEGMTKEEKEILVRALNLFINSQSYIVDKVDAAAGTGSLPELKLAIHKNIKIAENLKRKYGSD